MGLGMQNSMLGPTYSPTACATLHRTGVPHDSPLGPIDMGCRLDWAWQSQDLPFLFPIAQKISPSSQCRVTAETGIRTLQQKQHDGLNRRSGNLPLRMTGMVLSEYVILACRP